MSSPDDALFARRRPRSLWFPTILSLVLQVPVAAVTLNVEHVSVVGIVAVALGILSAFALLARRDHPGPVVVAAGLLSASAIAFGAGPPFAAVPLAIAVVGGILRGARIWVWSTLAGVAVVVPSIAFAVTQSPTASIRPLVVALVLCFFVGVGEVMRTRRDNYRELSRLVGERRRSEAEAERLRIARELHDVLAHSLSQISVQAGVGLHLFDVQPEKARDSLAAIKLTSGQALEEVRGVLGFLRREGAVPGDESAERSPAPGLGRLPDLVETARASGLDVDFSTDLDSSVPDATQLALYRIVQEALTNTSRHSGATAVRVSLEATPSDYLATIADNGRGQEPTSPAGRGITGMRERAQLLGGTVTASRAETGGFVVEARLPRSPSSTGRAPGSAW